jgi:hypothetical protein
MKVYSQTHYITNLQKPSILRTYPFQLFQKQVIDNSSVYFVNYDKYRILK